MAKKYRKITVTNEYILAEGELPVCLVAHLDTVFTKLPIDIYYDKQQKVMWSPQGLGADDRAGVYAIIQIIEDGYRPSVLFTTDEELGAVGAQALVTQKPDCPLENLKAIFQLDRQGMDDMVFYGCNNPDFENYIEKFGFTFGWGTFSDISVIAPAWKVAAVNLSIGYVGEHMQTEILHTDWMESTIEKVEQMLSVSDAMLSYAYIPMMTGFQWGGKNCMYCNKKLTKKHRHIVQGKDQYGNFEYFLCDKCYQDYISV